MHKIESPTVLESNVLFCRVVVYVPVLLLAAAALSVCWHAMGFDYLII